MNSSDSAIASDALVTTDAMGVFTHGTKLLAGYLNKLKAGGYRATARPCVEREGLGFALIDGQNALGQVGSVFAMQTAIKKPVTLESLTLLFVILATSARRILRSLGRSRRLDRTCHRK